MNAPLAPAGYVFYLGAPAPGWLAKPEVNAEQAPLMVSDRRLRVYKTLPRARVPWVLDSGGFSELKEFGTWTVTPAEYAARARRYQEEIGQLAWAAPQDWMCEQAIIDGGQFGPQRFVGTHLSVPEHHLRTVVNAVELSMLAPDVRWLRIVQGDTPEDYERCDDLYLQHGIDLRKEPLVGVGSVCRRQGTGEGHAIFTALRARGLTRLHGFGVKTLGLRNYDDPWASTDSMAWAFTARRLRRPALPECVRAGRHKNCANCLRYALTWRRRLLNALLPEPSHREAA
ncbi:DUF7221 family queuine tRNA-ribosyltransferase-like protein [Cryptosporangium aurantiacum]|uniref:DeoxyPurine in DNA protein A domain-containing protein n=1 Tax=Cryptosporangium aurantiacum TaxID=134849 RepID=A0A1M7RK46_9ACTN|nr:hypothetical protein [Cryptosporangium aurantiacum]SHN46438.1 hypothetical protein SAMN05443668_115127 [Cryptosporangium aurantiacum]